MRRLCVARGCLEYSHRWVWVNTFNIDEFSSFFSGIPLSSSSSFGTLFSIYIHRWGRERYFDFIFTTLLQFEWGESPVCMLLMQKGKTGAKGTDIPPPTLYIVQATTLSWFQIGKFTCTDTQQGWNGQTFRISYPERDDQDVMDWIIASRNWEL